MSTRLLATLWLLFLVGLLVAACGESRSVALAIPSGGDASAGRAAVKRYGCGSCHQIPGVRGAQGLVGPPLEDFARRKYIAGNLPNEAENLVAWIMDPQAVEPGTAMPTLGVTEQDARHIAAYLASLR
jgi:cytochrome c